MRRVISLLLLLTFVICFTACNESNETEEQLKASDLQAICELATLKCYYNNVAKVEKQKDNIFQKDREMWIEYESEAIIGIDMSELTIDISGDTVKIHLPKAKLLSIKAVPETLNEDSYVTTKDGLVANKITTEEQQKAIILAQEKMRVTINANKSLFLKAENKAKELLENHINKLGEMYEKEYVINWQ